MLQKVKRGIARLIDAYSEGLLDKSEFEPRVRRAKERLAELEKQAKVQADLEEQQRELRLVIGRLQEFAERVREGLNGADWSTRREIIRTLVKRVEIGDDDVRVIYRVDVSPFVEGPEGGRLPYCWRSHRPQARFPSHNRTSCPSLRKPSTKSTSQHSSAARFIGLHPKQPRSLHWPGGPRQRPPPECLPL